MKISLILASSLFLFPLSVLATPDPSVLNNRITIAEGTASNAAMVGLAAGTLVAGSSIVRRMIRL